jgi:tRNA(Ile)-lysidine synthase
MKMGLLEKVKTAIKEYRLLEPESGVVAGVSGGPDSMALLHCLVALRPEYKLQLWVVHINHGLRGAEADREAAFVAAQCANLAVPVKVYRVDVKAQAKQWKCSLEEAGHRVRYQCFAAWAKECGLERIAVAHHALDQAETVLENLLRGSGLPGLGGMDYRRDAIIRPLLGVTREEIDAFLAEKKIDYCLDPSNQEPIYLRNRIRLELLPHLVGKYNPKLVESLNRMSEIVREENALIEDLTTAAISRCTVPPPPETPSSLETPPRFTNSERAVLLIPQLLAEPKAIQRRLVRRLLGEVGGGLRKFNYQHIESVLELARNSAGGRRVYLPGNIQGRRDKNRLILEPRMVRRKKD